MTGESTRLDQPARARGAGLSPGEEDELLHMVCSGQWMLHVGLKSTDPEHGHSSSMGLDPFPIWVSDEEGEQFFTLHIPSSAYALGAEQLKARSLGHRTESAPRISIPRWLRCASCVYPRIRVRQRAWPARN
jgi:hypothetical protein